MKPLVFLRTAYFKKKVAFTEDEPVPKKVILVFLVNNIFSKIFGTSNGHMPVVVVAWPAIHSVRTAPIIPRAILLDVLLPEVSSGTRSRLHS